MDVTNSSGYRDFMWAIHLQCLGFEMVGLWPKPNKCTKKSLWPEIKIGIILILLIFVSNIPMIHAIIHVWGNIVFVIDTLHTTLPLVVVSMKYIIILRKRMVVLSIVNMMVEDWTAFKLDEERDVMIKRAQTACLIIMIGYVLTIMGLLTIIIPSYFGFPVIYVTNSTDRRKSLPLETYHFYDTNKSPQFELTFFIQTLTTLFAIIIYMSVDIFLIVMILHICGQLENFRCRLINLISYKNFHKIIKL